MIWASGSSLFFGLFSSNVPERPFYQILAAGAGVVNAAKEKNRLPGGAVELPGTLREVATLQLRQFTAAINQFAALEFAVDEFISVQDNTRVLLRQILEDRHVTLSVNGRY